MKTFCQILVLASLVQLALYLPAQTPTSPCDTLILPNDRVLSVRIDSIVSGVFVYKFCDSNNPNQYRLSATMVTKAKINSNPKLSDASAELDSLKQIARTWSTVKKWIFKHRVKKIMRSISKGQDVQVTYQDSFRVSTIIRGKLKNIELVTNQLTIETAQGKEVYINTQQIDLITIYDKKQSANRGVGWAFLVLGIIGFVIAASVYSKRARAQSIPFFVEPTSGETLGCLGGILAFILGAILLALSAPTKIIRPFSKDWTITETPEGETSKDQDVQNNKIP